MSEPSNIVIDEPGSNINSTKRYCEPVFADVNGDGLPDWISKDWTQKGFL